MLASLVGKQVLAQGGQARIYAWAPGLILRYPLSPPEYERLEYEYHIYEVLKGRLPLPRAEKLLYFDERPCLVLERIEAPTLAQVGAKNWLGLWKTPKTLAEIHQTVFVPVDQTVKSQRQKAEYCLQNSEVLERSQKEKLLRLLDSLPEESTLCHGDFHPENILAGNKGYVLIDWSSATRGSPLADIANTALLMINLPYFSSVNRRTYERNRRVTRFIGKRYVRHIARALGLDLKELGKYFLVSAGERTYYGQDEEKAQLKNFLDKHLDGASWNILRLSDKDFTA